MRKARVAFAANGCAFEGARLPPVPDCPKMFAAEAAPDADAATVVPFAACGKLRACYVFPIVLQVATIAAAHVLLGMMEPPKRAPKAAARRRHDDDDDEGNDDSDDDGADSDEDDPVADCPAVDAVEDDEVEDEEE